MVRYLVYCVIFAVPAAPSWRRASSLGITTASSCRMMLAVMYGMMPSAKTVSRSSAPPLSRFTRPRMPFLVDDATHVCTAVSETPGVGSDAPSRKIMMMKSVKSSFLRRSGVRKAW